MLISTAKSANSQLLMGSCLWQPEDGQWLNDVVSIPKLDIMLYHRNKNLTLKSNYQFLHWINH